MKFGVAAATLVLLSSTAGHSLYADVLQTPADAEPQTNVEEPSDTEIRELLVQGSIDRHTGPCACPYHRK